VEKWEGFIGNRTVEYLGGIYAWRDGVAASPMQTVGFSSLFLANNRRVKIVCRLRTANKKLTNGIWFT
jgi:hypothetical protein